MLEQRKVYLILAVGVAAVSVAAILVRLAAAPGLIVAAYRMIFASAVLLPISVRALRATPLRGKLFGYTLLAGIFLGAHFATFINSLSYTSVAASVTLVTTQPLWIALFSWLLGRRPGLLTLTGVLIATLGGALIGFGDVGGSVSLLGNSLALAGAVFAAAYFMLGRVVQASGVSLNAYVGAAYAVAALTLLPTPLLFDVPYTGYSRVTFGWILLLALVPQLIGHTSINYAIKRLDPTLVATTILLEPVGAGLLAFFIFNEAPGRLTLLGAAILLSGVALTLYSDRPPQALRANHEGTTSG